MQMVSVPNVNQRDQIPMSAIHAIVEQIAHAFKPDKIVLFGSYVYGRPRPESDVDLLVVMDTALKEAEQAIQICRSIQYDFGLDLIVKTPTALARRVALGDHFLREVIERGKVLYERTDR
jgi:predicted nucleotidyltransferase